MPQIFQVLRCYKCMVFQVHQTKKSNKFQCKLCGEKQSIKRHYGVGTAKDCRLHVQKLNGIRGEIDELKETTNSDSDKEENEPVVNITSQVESSKLNKSKWSDFVDNTHEENLSKPDTETMYLNDAEVVLEIPKKRRRKNFKTPSIKTPTDTCENNYSCEESESAISRLNIFTLSRVNDGKGVSIYNSCKPISTSEVYSKNLETESNINSSEYIAPPVVNNKKEVCKLLPPKVSSNSKWAQFVELEEACEEDEGNNDNITNNSVDSSYEEHDDNLSTGHPEKSSEDINIAEELFALCDDSDLDNILDI